VAESIIRDIFSGLKDYMTGYFSGLSADVQLAFKDERIGEQDDRTYPAIRLSLYNITFDNDRRYGGMQYSREDNPDGKTAQLKKGPIPIDLHFQMDTYCTKQDTDWQLSELCMKIMGSKYTRIETGDERTLWIVPETIDVLDRIEKNILFRKVYRFFVQIWFEHPEVAETVYLILTRRLEMQGSLYSMDATSE